MTFLERERDLAEGIVDEPPVEEVDTELEHAALDVVAQGVGSLVTLKVA